MSKLEELIRELCPNGADEKRIDEICDISRGRVMSKDYIQENEGEYPVYSSQTENNGELGRISTYDYEGEYLTWTTDGANAGSVFYRNGKFSITNVCGLLKVKKDDVLTRYLYHTMQIAAPKYVNKGMGNPKLMSNVMARIKLAVPPLEVQREIVRVLDSFTLLTAELTKELMEELTARKIQYDYYTKRVLTFGVDTPTVQLRELVDFRNGKGHEKNIDSKGSYIVVNSKFISTKGEVKKYSKEQICPLFIDDILMVMSDLPNGKALAKCFMVEADDKYTLNQRIGAFHVKDENVILTKFLFYTLNRNEQLLRYDNGVDQTNLRKDAILNIDIPVPTIEVQENIVEILDKFSELCDDISSGLSFEIDARRKQYEYYRDKLISFSNINE